MPARCGKLVRCWDERNRPTLENVCLCEMGHPGGCNPFSTTPFFDKLVFNKPLSVDEVLSRIEALSSEYSSAS